MDLWEVKETRDPPKAVCPPREACWWFMHSVGSVLLDSFFARGCSYLAERRPVPAVSAERRPAGSHGARVAFGKNQSAPEPLC